MTARDRKDAKIMSRFIKLAAVSALGLAVGGCAAQPRQLTAANNTSVYSLHQPVVEHTNYVFDLRVEGDRISEAELERLAAWFQSIGARYGDRLTVDEARGGESASVRGDVARVAADFGLLLVDSAAPVTEGRVEAGSVRVVASRASAHVEGCPNWTDPGIESPVRTGTNYGCAINSNLAAMIADPDDLVRGRSGSGQESSVVAGRAIRTYRERTPSGSQPLPSVTTRGGQ
jgi:pilus assembly protein CpaD